MNRFSRMTAAVAGMVAAAWVGFEAARERGIALAPVATAAESSADGWIDLTPKPGFEGWKRVATPDSKLAEKNPWSVSDDGKLLLCDGVGAKEMLLNETTRGDGVFHVEWRFRPTDAKLGYNGGAYVRTALDGKTWVQAQIAELDNPPRAGDLFGDRIIDSEPVRFELHGDGHKLVKPVGEWNAFDILCEGKKITVKVNDKVAIEWDECPFASGSVGLQAEHYFVEYRNLRYKPKADK